MTGLDVSLNDVVNYLTECDDEQFTEVFALYWKLRNVNKNASEQLRAEDIVLNADDMEFDVNELVTHLKDSLDEIIFSDDIDSSAWWKEKKE